MAALTVGELKIILNKYDDNMPLCITHCGKDHQYGVKDEDIFINKSPYFGNDPETEEYFYGCNYDWEKDEPINFLNIGTL